MMQLSKEATLSLRKILKKELGEHSEMLSDAQVNAIGVRLLKLTSVSLGRKIRLNTALSGNKNDKI